MRLMLTMAAMMFIAAISCARMLDDPNLSEGNGPQFHCRVGQLLATSPDSICLQVVVAVPYDNLHFVRADSGFVATSELVSSLYNKQGALVAEQMSDPMVFTTDYHETNLATQAMTHADKYVILPGDYRVRVVFMERESDGESRFETEISLAPPDSLLRLSDVFWVQESASGLVEGLRIVKFFFTDQESALARFQTASVGAESLQIEWQIVGAEAESLGTHVFRVAPTPEPTLQELRVNLQSLGSGDYALHVEAEGSGRRVARELPFSVSLRGLPRSVVQIDLAIRQARYIASGEEMRRMQESPPYRREEAFREFWRQRDPTPNTEQNELMEEYYYRVEYSNENFSTNRDGWETDRGRIYILYGEPTDIERHPFEINSKPYEVWYYDHMNRRFVFVDYTGFGDYELAWPEGIR